MRHVRITWPVAIDAGHPGTPSQVAGLNMPIHEFLGWCASALMVATFACRRPLRMRSLAVCTNLAFMAYAATNGLPPVLALHALLLPINLLRAWQAWHGSAGDAHPSRGAWSDHPGAGSTSP